MPEDNTLDSPIATALREQRIEQKKREDAESARKLSLKSYVDPNTGNKLTPSEIIAIMAGQKEDPTLQPQKQVEKRRIDTAVPVVNREVKAVYQYSTGARIERSQDRDLPTRHAGPIRKAGTYEYSPEKLVIGEQAASLENVQLPPEEVSSQREENAVVEPVMEVVPEQIQPVEVSRITSETPSAPQSLDERIKALWSRLHPELQKGKIATSEPARKRGNLTLVHSAPEVKPKPVAVEELDEAVG